MRKQPLKTYFLAVSALLVVGAVEEGLNLPRSSAFWARQAEHIGLNGVAARLYHFNVSSYPDQALPASFGRLSRLRTDPNSLVEIASHALQGGHKGIAAHLYGEALEKAGDGASANWLTKYAELIATCDSEAAANLYLVAADRVLDRDRRPSEIVNMYVDQSLALRENVEVRWKMAQLNMRQDIRRGELALRRITSSRQKEAVAHHTLGMILWDLDRIDEAESSLIEAAKDGKYQAGLQQLRQWQRARQELRELEAAETDLLAQVERDNVAAISEHEALYERLRQAVCDIRQFQGWEHRSRDDLYTECQTKLIMTGLEAIITLGLMATPVGRVGRLGAAAELGVVARGVRASRAVAAEAEASVYGARQQSADTARAILTERKSRVVHGYNFSYFRGIEAEHYAAITEVNTSFLIARQTVRAQYQPLKAEASGKLSSSQAFRARIVSEFREVDVRLGVKMKLSNHFPPCQWNASWQSFYELVRSQNTEENL